MVARVTRPQEIVILKFVIHLSNCRWWVSLSAYSTSFVIQCLSINMTQQTFWLLNCITLMELLIVGSYGVTSKHLGFFILLLFSSWFNPTRAEHTCRLKYFDKQYMFSFPLPVFFDCLRCFECYSPTKRYCPQKPNFNIEKFSLRCYLKNSCSYSRRRIIALFINVFYLHDLIKVADMVLSQKSN